MTWVLEGFESECEHGIAAMHEASAAIMAIYDRVGRDGLDVVQKADDRGPVTEADQAGNDILVARLRAAFPADGMLAEESADDGGRLASDRFWCVDPLDGTKEFIRRNGEFSVMVGLVDRKSGRPIFGMVLEPVAGYLTIAAAGRGAWVFEGDAAPRRVAVSGLTAGPELRIIGSRSHPDPQTTTAVELLGAGGITPCGSVGVKIGRIVQDRADVYMNYSGRTWMWDTCGPDIILEEGGGKLTDLAGRPLNYARASALNDMAYVATNGVSHARVLGACRSAAGVSS